MITSLSQFLEQLQEKEAAILAEQSLTHGPTIGDMYEGLTRELLERAIPEHLNLRLVDGFVEGVDGKLSHQTDAMLVMGEEGRRIPKTDKWIWPIQDVLAVFEVKKNLYASELLDSIAKMRAVSVQHQQLLAAKSKSINLGPSRQAFARIMGRFPHSGEMDDFANPGGEILRTVAFEQLAPIRVVFGYQGYADEAGLREAFLDALEKAPGNIAGPAVLPNLIICRKNAVIKLNGHPFLSPLQENGQWNLFGSTHKAPFSHLLEFIWTRLANQFDAQFPLDDSLEMEAMAFLLAGEPVVKGDTRGWQFYSRSFSKETLAKSTADTWSPVEVTLEENVLVTMANTRGGLDVKNADLLEAASAYGIDLSAFATRLVESRLFSWVSPGVAQPISDVVHQAITPDGRFILADNDKLLRLWIREKMKEAKSTAS